MLPKNIVARTLAGNVLQVSYFVDVCPAITPVEHAARLLVSLQQFEVEVLEDDRLDIRRALAAIASRDKRDVGGREYA